MLRLALYAAVLLALPLAAQTPATDTAPPTGFTQAIVLWPGGAPLALRTGAAATDGDIPKLFTYPAPGPGPHPAVIVMPGGGYTHLVMGKEGDAAAKWLNTMGVSAFVLEYRLSPAYRFPAPMLDASRAIRYVRTHATELAIDPNRLGVWGFSAGGHLAGYFATLHKPGDPAAVDPLDRISERPDFAILAYARVDLGSSVPRPAATTASPGMEIVLAATTEQLNVVPRVTADNSPSFIYSTTGDQTVDSRNAADLYVALKRAGVPAELHIFEQGPHGTGMGQGLAEKELAIWPTLLAHWMHQHNWMPEQP